MAGGGRKEPDGWALILLPAQFFQHSSFPRPHPPLPLTLPTPSSFPAPSSSPRTLSLPPPSPSPAPSSKHGLHCIHTTTYPYFLPVICLLERKTCAVECKTGLLLLPAPPLCLLLLLLLPALYQPAVCSDDCLYAWSFFRRCGCT